jgi:uncharacterized protein YjbJ (UPF0337 family)
VPADAFDSRRLRSSAGERLLGIYLDDHRAGAAAGLALAKRFATANAMTFLADTAGEVCRQIDEDARTLDDVLDRLGHRSRRWKQVVARATELIGRLKTNGFLRQYSPLSRVIEIEMLSAGILTKQALWESLAVIAEHRPELHGIDFGELQRRAQQQRLLLSQHRLTTVHEAFFTGIPPSEAGRVPTNNTKETAMSGNTDKVKGHVKQAVGELTDDKDLESEGKVDELAGKAKDVVDKAKDKLTGKD